MASAFVQEKSNTGTGTTVSVTLDSAIGDGNFLVVTISAIGAGSSTASVAGGGAGTLTIDRADNNIGIWNTAIAHGWNSGGGSAAIVVTFDTAPSTGATVNVTEYSGVPTSGFNSWVNGANGTNGTAISVSVTPDSSAEVIFHAAGSFQGTGTTATVGPSGWADLDGMAPTTARSGGRKTVTSTTGSYTATWGIGYNRYAASLVAYLVAAGGGGGGGGMHYYRRRRSTTTGGRGL